MAECKLTIEELGPGILQPKVLKIMNKYVDCAKADPQQRLEALLSDPTVATWIEERREDVEAAIKECEILQLLSDTVIECRKAPEWLGRVVGKLVKAGACTKPFLNDHVQDCLTINVDELMADKDETMKYYNSFMDEVEKIAQQA